MRRKTRRGGGRQAEVLVESLGARGDGVAQFDGRPLFLPQTVAGDRVLARVTGEKAGAFKGEVIELLEEGPGRVAPPCPYFGPCGGCQLQHLEDARYGDWKADLLRQALSRRGFGEVPLGELIRIPPGTRRRATLAATRRGKGVILGFHEPGSHRVVDVSACLLLTPSLLALLDPLRAVLPSLLVEGEIADVFLCDTESGLDVLLVSRQAPDLAAREALAAFAVAADIARLTWCEPQGEPEPVVLRRPPRVSFAGVTLDLPPGAFLQPSRDGEAALTRLLLDALPAAAASAADLFCGCGTFTFPLAEHGLKVRAVEGVAEAAEALLAAAQASPLAGKVRAEVRDLMRAPLLPQELAGLDLVVFDPPRQGAREQAAALAASEVATVIAVSCNPNSFARDARLLVDGGYRLESVTPLDQFPWTGHLELVAKFTR